MASVQIVLEYINNIEMSNHCSCSHHTTSQDKTIKKEQTVNGANKKVDHIIRLLQNTYISPYKIMYLLDPKQADYFKQRNQAIGCCSSNHITISQQSMTKAQKILKQLISYSSLSIHLDTILSYCSDRLESIKASGRKDKMEINDQVQKFLIDKVMMESANNFVYLKLADTIKNQSISLNKEMGLWATPATWYQRYPQVPLNSIPNIVLSQLFNQGWSISSQFFAIYNQRVNKQMNLLEKDGKFQQCSFFNESSSKTKVLNNPQTFAEMKNSNGVHYFSTLREVMILLSSFPFELNAKANLFCTVSPNNHIYYNSQHFVIKQQKSQLKFAIIVNFGRTTTIKINQKIYTMIEGSLLFIDNQKIKYQLTSDGQTSLFLIRNYIGCVARK